MRVDKRIIALIMSTALLLSGCEGGVSAQDLRDEQYRKQQFMEVTEGVYDSASDTIKTGEEKIGEAASGAAEGVKDTASKQADELTEDKEHLSGVLSDEWHDLLDKLQTPTGISETFDNGAQDNAGTYEDGSGSSKDAGNTITVNASEDCKISSPPFNIDDIGHYTGSTIVTVNGNRPYFTESDTSLEPFEIYSGLDRLGRCGTAYANICAEIMPTEDRGDIGMIKPTGWVQKKYEGIIDEDPPYLYNRCHLIAYCLAGENANPENLITGTRHFNIETGMEKYELEVLSYVKRTGNHVLYRVTPVFEGDNLLATGVLMEGRSVEDNGISYCVFVYNVQPGIKIDYSTGESSIA